MAYVLAPTPARNSKDNPEEALRAQGFRRAAAPEFVIMLIGGKAREEETCSIYQKRVEVGEKIQFGRWGILVF
jgi:hypothetical protein